MEQSITFRNEAYNPLFGGSSLELACELIAPGRFRCSRRKIYYNVDRQEIDREFEESVTMTADEVADLLHPASPTVKEPVESDEFEQPNVTPPVIAAPVISPTQQRPPSLPQEVLDETLPGAQWDYTTDPKTLLNPSEVYDVVKTLGKGGFGQVVLIQVKATGQLYALKVLLKADPENLREEIGTLMDISAYPNCRADVACYYDAFQFVNKSGAVNYGILMEYVEGTTLFRYVQENGTSKQLATNTALWLTKVLAELHAVGVAHRDIKSDNILITNTGALKLIDFGLTCALRPEITPDAPSCDFGIAGTPGYMSPEIVDGRVRRNPDYLKAADVFAAGATLYEITESSQLPYQLAADGWTPVPPLRPFEYNEDCFNQVVNEMLYLNPDQRPTALQANLEFGEC